MNNFLYLIPVVILVVYWIGAFFLVYHLLKYGITNWPKRLATIFLLGSLFMSVLSFMLFNQIDWGKTLNSDGVQQIKNLTNTKK
jgi:hypothetical protein